LSIITKFPSRFTRAVLIRLILIPTDLHRISIPINLSATAANAITGRDKFNAGILKSAAYGGKLVSFEDAGQTNICFHFVAALMRYERCFASKQLICLDAVH
jgi:hypothetical protein